MGFLSDLFSGGAERRAAEQNRSTIGAYQRDANAYLDRGVGQASGFLNQAQGLYAPLADTFGRGSGLYADALGVNGADGSARATAAFQTGPGYQWAVDQALEGINRKQNVNGALVGGNTLAALGDRAGQMANQEYGGWLDRLGGYDGKAMQTAGAQAGVYGSLADLYNQDSQNRANIASSVASGNMSATNQEAAGRSAGARNLLSAGMGLASLAAGGMGGGSLLGGLGSMFGGGQTGPTYANQNQGSMGGVQFPIFR